MVWYIRWKIQDFSQEVFYIINSGYSHTEPLKKSKYYRCQADSADNVVL